VLFALTANRALAPARSICVEAPSFLDEPSGLRRADGSSVFTEHAAGRYTSQGVLDTEAQLVNADQDADGVRLVRAVSNRRAVTMSPRPTCCGPVSPNSITISPAPG
jgi:hypothetical protein